MQLIIEENDLIFCYLIKYVIWILLFTVKITFVITIFLCIIGWIWIQIVHLDHHLDPDPDFQKKISKNFFVLIFTFPYVTYENLTNLPLNKSEGPYTTKLVKLYITYFVIFKLLKLLKLFSLSGSFLFLKVEVTPNKSSSWILISCFVKLAQSEHSLQNVHNKHGQHGWKVSANCQNNVTFFIFLSFKVWFWDWKFMEYRSGTVNSNMVNSKFHLIQSLFEIFARFLSFHV